MYVHIEPFARETIFIVYTVFSFLYTFFRDRWQFSSQSRNQVCVHVFSNLELFRASRDILNTNTPQHAQRSRKTRSRILEPQHAPSQNVTQHKHKAHALFVYMYSREQVLVKFSKSCKFSNSRDRSSIEY